ncbi:MAG: type II secretion system minor pseudopilin GspI [Pseudomonadota bacterium]|nr:type II secretion system minor pseudopilin GspI [Pseudomonadota bacterium]
MKGSRGFTLLEVLVAMAIIAVALGAAVRTLGQAADIGGALADRTLARWVAEDHAALLRAELPRNFPASGQREGRIEQDRRNWHWREIASDPPESPFRRIEIHVRVDDGADGDQAALTLFVLRPPQ